MKISHALLLLLLLRAPSPAAAATTTTTTVDNSTPVVIFTHAWPAPTTHSACPQPAWLMIPALLDVHPVVLRVDVRRDAEMQLRSFCRAHGLDASLCGAGLHRALREIVDLERICRQQRLEAPAFVVAKNLIRKNTDASSSRPGGARAPSFSWLQDEAQNIATDLCHFAKLGDDSESSSCTAALESALQHSFDWINALPSCKHLRKRHSATKNHAVDDGANKKSKISTVELTAAALSDQPPQHLVDERAPQSQQHQPHDSEGDNRFSSEEYAPSTGAIDLVHEAYSTDKATPANPEIRSGSMDEANVNTSVTPAATAESDVTMTRVDDGAKNTTEVVGVATLESEHIASTTADDAHRLPETADGEDEEGSHTRADSAISLHETISVTVSDQQAMEDDNVRSTEDSILPSTAKEATIRDSEATPLASAGNEKALMQILIQPLPNELSEFDNEPAPELLRVLSTLAMLLFIVYLVVDVTIAGIRSIAYSELVHRCKHCLWIVLRAILSLVIHSDSTVRKSASVLPSAPPSLKHTANDPKLRGKARQRFEPPRSLLRPYSLLLSRAERRSLTQELLQRQALAIEKVAKAHLRRVQREAFEHWQLSVLHDGSSITTASCEISSNDSGELSPATSVVNMQTKATAPPPSFTCVAMALMFTRHGSYYHRVASNRSKTKGVEPKRFHAGSLLLENHHKSDSLDGSCSSEANAARRIQLAWRKRHKRRSGPSLPIKTTLYSAFDEHLRAASTPMLSLLDKKNYRKQVAQQTPMGTGHGFPTFRGMLTPAASVNLPPCS